jgi:AraC-like DNA-binding protein
VAQPSVTEFRSDDPDEIRDAVASVFCRHEMRTRAAEPDGRRPTTTLTAFRSDGFGLVELDYGTGVVVRPDLLGEFYLVQVPRSGRTRVRHGREEVVATEQQAFVLGPDRPTIMERSTRNPQLIVYVHRDTVQRTVGDLLGRDVAAPVRFALGMRFGTPALDAWRRGVMHLAGELDARSPVLSDGRWVRRARQGVVEQLLVSQQHDHLAEIVDGRPGTSRAVARCRRLVEDRGAADLTVADLARHAGVSLRTLQDGFRSQLGLSPSQFLRAHRLDAAREALRAGDPATTSVTEVALDHGFGHFGRFSADYRARHGELPSQTLRR